MAARKASASKEPAPCPECKKAGQVSESFKVGARSKRESSDRQEALCLTCFGTGEAPTD